VSSDQDKILNALHAHKMELGHAIPNDAEMVAIGAQHDAASAVVANVRRTLESFAAYHDLVGFFSQEANWSEMWCKVLWECKYQLEDVLVDMQLAEHANRYGRLKTPEGER